MTTRDVMNRRSSSLSSLPIRTQDYSRTVPFVPRDVFRLVVRLEAQKALDVNVAALEQRFHVPSGYADDETLNARGEVKRPKNNVPGPGTYEVREQWPARDVTATPTSSFLSGTTRGSFGSTRLASPKSPSRNVAVDSRVEAAVDMVVRPHTAKPGLKSPHSRLRLPRRNLSTPDQQHSQQQHEASCNGAEYCTDNTCNPWLSYQNTHVFSKTSREPGVNKAAAPPVGSYDVKRLWDSPTFRSSPGDRSSALFGASKEKRVVTWRPALTPASNAISTSWDSSDHYVKQKRKVARGAAKRKIQSAKLHAKTVSSLTLRPSTAAACGFASTDSSSVETSKDDDDPFSWLRQRPNGEQRINLLAARHGLVQHIKSPTRRSTDIRRSVVSHMGDQTVRDNNLEDGEAFSAAPQLVTSTPKDSRIKVSCRMPGGLLISVSAYSMKKLGRFKEAILIRQKRFKNVNQFDLFHTTGRKLTALDDTLAACGIHDRSLLQIVPAIAVVMSPHGPTMHTS